MTRITSGCGRAGTRRWRSSPHGSRTKLRPACRGGSSRRRDCQILLHLPLPSAGVSIGMWRGRQQNDSLADGAGGSADVPAAASRYIQLGGIRAVRPTAAARRPCRCRPHSGRSCKPPGGPLLTAATRRQRHSGRALWRGGRLPAVPAAVGALSGVSALSLPFHRPFTVLSPPFHRPFTALLLPFHRPFTALLLPFHRPFTALLLPFHRPFAALSLLFYCPFTAFHRLSPHFTALSPPFLLLSLLSSAELSRLRANSTFVMLPLP